MTGPKIGIVGAGGIAPSHIEGFQKAGAEVAAIANRSPGKAEALAARYTIPVVCGSLDEMLAKVQGLDAISIVTPNFTHAALAMQALRAGLHVFCEKPPALNAHETEAMCDTAQRAGKILMFNFNNRARPESQAIIDFIQKGGVGKINSAQTQWVRKAGIPGYGSWFTNRKLSGGGAMIDLLHMADLALYFMGYPNPDYVLARTFSNFQHDEEFRSSYGSEESSGVMDVETACHAMVTFRSGQCLTIRTSWAEMNERELASVVFQGAWAGGRIERAYSNGGKDETSIDTCKLFLLDNGKMIEKPLVFGPGPDDLGRRANAANFVQAVRGETRPLNTPAQALRLMKIIDAIYESAETRTAVQVDG
ncbi:MAG: Gfo/Idh/MocA family oxidoreductase [Spirochaetaceae bacterium]|nr:Gfo/Idh/MocA family oxidoreductase [Spirochaetaceae bacterium]